MSIAPRASACAPADVEAWLAELGLAPLERADREGVTSWDLRLDGRRRASLRVTVILDPALALICWAHYAPPIADAFRKSYRKLLRWNDELPFVKFAVSEDERPVLTTEISVGTLDRDVLGIALARLLAVCDLLLTESLRWLEPGARNGKGGPRPPARPSPLLERYADQLGELVTVAPADAGDGSVDPADDEEASRLGDAAVTGTGGSAEPRGRG
jgi:Putative bacterial sensory transduction regulator